MPPLAQFIKSLSTSSLTRTEGAGAYLFSEVGVTPPALIASLHHHEALHEQVLIVCVVIEPRPRVPTMRCAVVTDLGHGFHQVVLHFGFMEQPDVPRALAQRVVAGLGIDLVHDELLLGK